MGHASVLIGLAAFLSALGPAATAAAAPLHADMALTSGVMSSVGSVDIADGPNGAVFTLHLHGLPPGPHGFHIHQNGSCAAAPGKDGAMVAGGAAGPHLDPDATGKHMGPDGAGHLGDLPFIVVGPDGTADGVLTAPRIKDAMSLKGRALMLHVGSDNYSDLPAPLGGGGARLACGVVG